MAKTNYSLVEQRLVKGLRRMFVNQLMALADIAQGTFEQQERTAAKRKVTVTQRERSRKNIARALRRNLQRLLKKEHLHEEFGISEQELNAMVENPGQLTPEDWKRLKQLKKELATHKDELDQGLEADLNETLVETERLKHVNKRFNIRDGWLPLK